MGRVRRYKKFKAMDPFAKGGGNTKGRKGDDLDRNLPPNVKNHQAPRINSQQGINTFTERNGSKIVNLRRIYSTQMRCIAEIREWRWYVELHLLKYTRFHPHVYTLRVTLSGDDFQHILTINRRWLRCGQPNKDNDCSRIMPSTQKWFDFLACSGFFLFPNRALFHFQWVIVPVTFQNILSLRLFSRPRHSNS